MRAVVALTSNRAALQTRASLATPPFWRFLSSNALRPPSNPFEINLNLSNPSSTTKKLSLDDAKRAAAVQQAEAERDIELMHNEMSSLFGEEVAEHYGSDSSSGVEAAFDRETMHKSSAVASEEINVAAAVEREETPAVPSKPVVKESSKRQTMKFMENAPRVNTTEERSSNISTKEKSTTADGVNDSTPSVLVLMGPCSVMCGVWTGGNTPLPELRSQIRTMADELKIKIKMRTFNAESGVLDLMLNAQPGQVVVLGWKISLSKSPFVVHALELIKSNVIIVSPNGVNHGPLPSNVVGVISGRVNFNNCSISLSH
ncbi:hypothetical protein BBO99_00002529 [Phytophthora kernoviae]|uniref:Uncharacterized protein n=2 Tax=Phytophthora kernoviae TaxID=325452 RepID=A0A421GWK5_9STRA|nr:hypothetical protein G195_002905 [Phytophthora kernoviae 00238/432]KAG2524491.1 hypothetical protein JM16_004901 [Phytophthora kernoviae]KAG2530608.1 hypothetical protein JM18_002065 [Phytophthora kernoviae]RLN36794.1 hypothetical protein BBI17_002379 [Phytophthora kernoviae]RLN82974.1 hypothetical protein BBO99_00002529 [Phytophthora kernoviae]